jgi:hypothetical protein
MALGKGSGLSMFGKTAEIDDRLHVVSLFMWMVSIIMTISFTKFENGIKLMSMRGPKSLTTASMNMSAVALRLYTLL